MIKDYFAIAVLATIPIGGLMVSILIAQCELSFWRMQKCLTFLRKLDSGNATQNEIQRQVKFLRSQGVEI